MKSKMGAVSLQDLLPVAMLLIVATVAIAIGADVITSIQDDQVDTSVSNCGTNATGGSGGTLSYTNCSYAYNISGYGLQAEDEFGSWLDTIALVIAAAIIISVLVSSFAMGR